MLNKPVIATWMVRDLPGEECTYSQVGSNSSNAEFQAVYWRSIAVFFASSLRVNASARHIFFTDRSNPVNVDGLEIFAWFNRQGVEVQTVPFTHRPPKGFWDSWGNQFYIFDIIANLPSDAPAFMVLDADCVWLRPAQDIFSRLLEKHLLAYTLDFDEEWVENGLTRNGMHSVYKAIWGEKCSRVPFYNGGEIMACDNDCLMFLRKHSQGVFDMNLDLFKQGLPYCREEAHMLSILYEKFGYDPFSANSFIRRIWTGSNYNDVRFPQDMSLAIWHLPYEKRLGIERLFRGMVLKNYKNSLQETDFIRYVGRLCGIPRRNRFKLFYDRMFRRVGRKISRMLE